MADIRSMFGKMGAKDRPTENGGAGDASQSHKKGTIEATYQKKSQLEHILLRPDSYIGSVQKLEEEMWVYDAANEKMVQRKIEYVPGLYKIFDEILVNAADNKQRDSKMDCIKITIEQENNTISIWNNGKGIPVVMHKEEKMFVPTMIFGHLLTSSNYDDTEEKVTGGRNGYGAKLCNIFSTKFIVETASKEYKRQFKQTWGVNMTKTSEPKVKEFSGEDFTKITFSPDLVKFNMETLDDDIVALMSRRAYDIAASARGVKVFLNGQRIAIKTFKDYVEAYVKDVKEEGTKIVHEVCSDRWEVAMTISPTGFQQMSFVNSIATTKGGRHVDHVVDLIVKQLIDLLKKKNKGGVAIKPFQVKNHMWIFINCLIVNPTFDSQTKENMTLQAKSFGSKCTLSENFIKQVTKCGIVESVLSWAKFKAETELEKKGGKKHSKIKGIPKLEDANEAGTKNAMRCTLILTEGDSAKSLAVSGLGVIGRDYYGVFPLKGKLLNVREATHKQLLENQEINNLIKILGLQYKKKYRTAEDMRSLRYGKVMIMTDQDQDGSHIKGLLINFIHYNWPELLHLDFLEEFITPIVKVRKRNEELSFYSLPEFEEWKATTPNQNTYNVKYYKGLGTSTSKEAKEYFSNMERHRIKFKYNGQEDDDHIVLAFSRKHIENRKEWLTNFMVESKRRKEVGLPDRYLYQKTTKVVSYADFINLEFILFSNADNIRSIPSMVDGVKPGQRKVLYTCFRRNDKREVKVAQLAGSVAEMSAYHHGEVSLCSTIVNLAQNFVGSNNINLLEPRGQFGTRMCGGKDSASPRYIFTKMSPLTRLIFNPSDDPLLKYEYDDNQKIEPYWYIPIIPMILVNGADGIGTGWMTKIPNYNPREVVKNLFLMMDGEEPSSLIPWYKNFKGTICDGGDQRYVISGEVSLIGSTKIEINELPVGTWTQNYKENVLEPILHGSEKIKPIINDYKEYNTDSTVRFVITVLQSEMARVQQEGIHKTFKLQSLVSTTSMCAFDELGCIKKYEHVNEILHEFYKLRLIFYQKRKNYMEGMLKAEADRLSNQARFILEKCSRELIVENKKRKAIIAELIQKGYLPDPVLKWKEEVQTEDDNTDEGPGEEDEEGDGEEGQRAQQQESPRDSEQVKMFDYLLGMSMWMLTEERKNELLRQRDNKLTELEILRKKSKQDLWKEDLKAFLEKLDVVEAKERADEAGSNDKNKKVGKKKKIDLQETMPTPNGKRVQPIITDELKKKIQAAAKLKENKNKKGKIKEEAASIDVDEFDAMADDKKTLADKIGTPEEVEKKVRAKKGAKDGLKQTTLNFKKAAEVNGKKKDKKKGSDDDSDCEIILDKSSDFASTPPVQRSKRNVKQKKYVLSDDEDADAPLSDNSELFDNDAVKENTFRQDVVSDSDMEEQAAAASQSKHETSEDMFDMLVGRKKDESPKPKSGLKRKKVERTSTQSDSDAEVSSGTKQKKKGGGRPKKKKDDGDDAPKKKKSDDDSSKKKRGRKPKKKGSDSDDDFDLGEKSTSRKTSDDDDTFGETPVKKVTRKVPAKKYVISDDESDF